MLLLEQLAATDIETAQTAMQDGTVYYVPESQHNRLKDFLISVARQTLGIPYKFGSNTFMRTDCSGYVQNVFSLMGLQLPRSAREQFNIGEPVDRKALSLGDLVFFRTYAPFPSHVGIYLGNNLFIHASTFAKKVTIDSLNMPYYVKRFLGAKRLPVDGTDFTGLREPSKENIR
ncbi:MAG: NlpC/P60 family protein [Nitrospiraceae bacterium]|nr:MAG: NlpC/P60 family protein [Nitrospiraceae bacterium]